MRKAILAFAMVAIVVAAAQSAGAVEGGFRGPYRLIARTTACNFETYRHRVSVHFVNERVRDLAHGGWGWNGRFRYVPGEFFPWQETPVDLGYTFRYDPGTGSAVGVRHGPQDCDWRVHLVPIG